MWQGFSIRRDEDLLLVESSQRDSWKVRNYMNNEDYVPAITVILPGPFKEAADLVNRYLILAAQMAMFVAQNKWRDVFTYFLRKNHVI